MFKHYLRTIVRQLAKRRLYASISLLSLTVGLTVFCLIVLNIRHELSYNSHWSDAERVFRMTHKQGGTNSSLPPTTAFSSEFLLNITNYIGDYVTSYAEISSLSSSVEIAGGEQPLQVTLADEAFLDVFEFPVVAGRLLTAMEGSGFIALDAESAALLFGSAESAIGKTLTLQGALAFSSNPAFMPAQATDFEVAAVYELPEPITRSTQFQAIIANNEYSISLLPGFNGVRNLGLNVWLKLADGVAPEILDTQLDYYLDEYLINTRENVELRGGSYSDLFDFKVQALQDVYFDQEIAEFPQGDRTRLLTFGLVAVLVLLAGSSNVISLGLAAAMERRREVGIRKAVGALQHSIVLQYLSEAIVLALAALIPTVLLVTLLHPAFAGMLSIANMPDPGVLEIALMAGICLCVGLINGSYPAWVLARVSPVAALRPHSTQSRLGRRLNLRGILVMAQFCFSIALLVITSGLYLQLWITRNQPLGFELNGLASASVNFQLLQARNDIGQVFANELATVPGILAVSPVPMVPMLNNLPPANMQLVNTQQDSEGVPVKSLPFKPGLFEIIGIPHLAGRDLDSVSDTLAPADIQNPERPARRVILNRTAVGALGFSDVSAVVGKRYYLLNDNGARRSYEPLDVVGVVEDSMYSSIRERPGAEFYYLEPFIGTNVLFRYDEAFGEGLVERVNEVAMEVTGFPATPVFLEEHAIQTFMEEQRESRLLLMCAGLALFLSCVGLYGLVSVALKAQVKEIGVRKVLGASTFGVVKTFLARFSVPVLLANVIAWPVASYVVVEWIKRFPYQLEKLWLLPICLGTTTLVLVIAWGTVGALTMRAASTQPVKALRYE